MIRHVFWIIIRTFTETENKLALQITILMRGGGKDCLSTQVTYARRIIGHKYYPFMNYQMPEHVYQDADPRLKRLLGFLPHGAYG